MHDYLLNDLAHITIDQRRREADEHRLGRAARTTKEAGSRSLGARWLARLRPGPFIEPVRPAVPRARVVVRRRTQAAETRRLA
jgi:hypothetical protein